MTNRDLVWETIRFLALQLKRPVTTKEVAQQVELSLRNVDSNLQVFKRRGWIRRSEDRKGWILLK